jgi:uncharacterized protein (UPF0335 family)
MKERLELNKQKLTGIIQRINELEKEKQELAQEALRLDGENRLLLEMVNKE